MSSAFFDHLDQYKPEAAAAESSLGGSDVDDIFSALISTEGSAGDAVSAKGATGSSQIMPDTFKQYALKGENYNNEADRVKAARRKVEDDYAWSLSLTDDPEHAKKLTAAAYFGGRGGAMLWARGKGGSRNDGILDINGYVDRFTSKIGSRVDAAVNPEVRTTQTEPIEQTGVDMSQWNVGRTDEPMRASNYGSLGQQASSDGSVDWGKKLGAAIDSYQAGLWSIPAAMGSDYALKAMQENKAAADQGFHDAGGPQTWDEMEFGKNFGQYFGHLFVQSAPYLAEFAATGFGIGSVLKKGLATTAESIATKAAAEAVTKGATAAQAAKIGNAAADGFFGTIGGVIGSYPSSTGDVLSNQYEQAGKFNLPAAAALGIPYAALNAAGVEGMMMRGLSRGLPEIAANVAGKGLAGAAGRAAITGAETGLIEGTTETGQEVMNQLGRMSVDPNATLTSGDAPERYKESFIAGSLMGGAMGAAAGPFRKPNSPLTNAANAAGGANAQGSTQVPPGTPPGGPQVPVGGTGAAPVGGQAGSPVPGAVPPIDPLTARNDAEIARITQEMAAAEARSEKLNSRALEGVPDDRLQSIADEFAFKAQQGVPLTPEQQRVAENVANEIEFRQMAASEAESLAQQTAVASRFSAMPIAGLTAIARSRAPAAQAARDELQRRSASTQPATPAPAGVSTSGVPNNGPATPAAEDAVVAAPGRPGQGDVLPGSPALAPTDGNVQPAPGRDIPAAVAAPGSGTAASAGTAGGQAAVSNAGGRNSLGHEANRRRFDVAISAIADFAQRYPAEAEVLRQNPDAIKAAIVGGASDQTRNHEDRKDLDMVFGEGYIAEGVRDPAVGAAIDRLQNHINSFANRDGAIGDMQAMQGDLMPGYSSVDITNEVKQALGIQTQPSAEQSPAAKPGGATGDGRSPVADENGFIAGPDNYRIRIGEHKAGSNFLDPQADAGALTYEVRKGNNDRSPLNMVVGKSGKLIEAEQALGLDQKSNGVAWIPPTPEAREKAIELLRKRAITKVGSNERKAIDAALTNVVTAPADKTEAAGEPRRGEVGGMVAAGEVGAAPAAGGIQKGEVGGKMGSGEVVLTASGRRTTPFPQIKSGPRGTATTVKAVDGWLMQNALDEAKSRGDNFNTRQFESNLANPSKADKDSAEEYLFGQQPDVPRPLLKPLVQQQQAPAEPQPGVTLNDVPPKLMRNLKVPVERLVGGEVKTVEVSANEAIADLDEEIAAYEKLLACVKAAA